MQIYLTQLKYVIYIHILKFLTPIFARLPVHRNIGEWPRPRQHPWRFITDWKSRKMPEPGRYHILLIISRRIPAAIARPLFRQTILINFFIY